MSKWEKDIDWMDTYLRGEMTAEEKQAFENKLSEDADFAKQFNELKLLKQSARLSKMDKVFQSLQETEVDIQSGKEKTGTTRRLWIRIAAAASIFLLAGLAYFLLKPAAHTPEQLFAESFSPYPNNVIKRSQQNNYSELKKSAYQAYDTKNYKKSIAQLLELYQRETDTISLFYLANACLADNQTDQAIEYFEAYLPNADALTNQTKWYLSLAYLKKGETVQAKEILDELAEGNHSYASKANEILNKID